MRGMPEGEGQRGPRGGATLLYKNEQVIIVKTANGEWPKKRNE